MKWEKSSSRSPQPKGKSPLRGDKIINSAKILRAFLVLVLFIVSFMVIQPFLTAIISGALLAYIFYPVYLRLYRKTKMKRVSALIVSVCLVILVTVPVVFALNALWKEAFTLYLSGKQQISVTASFFENCSEDSAICTIFLKAKQILGGTEGAFFETSLRKITSAITEFSSDFIIRLPQRILDIFIIMFVMYYLLIDGATIMKKFWNLTLIKKNEQEKYKQRISGIVYAVIYGSIITALIQGAIASAGYALFGIKSPVFWGVITAFAALLPFIGTALVWVPASLFKLFTGLSAGNSSEVWQGIGLFVYGMVLVSSIDNFIKPKIIGDKARIHPVLVLLGVLGGLAVFGYLGLLIGPLVLSIAYVLIEDYKPRR